MNYLLKSCSHTDIRNKMILVYLLNVTDIIFTLILCSTGCFMEANPLVAVFTSNSIAAILVKAALPALLLGYLYVRMKKASPEQLKKANTAVVLLMIVYALINISHITWLTLYTFKPSMFGIA
jgi:hypothetical protein